MAEADLLRHLGQIGLQGNPLERWSRFAGRLLGPLV